MDQPTILAAAVAAVAGVVALLAWLRARRRRQGAGVSPPRVERGATAASRLRRGLSATRRHLAAQIDAALGRGPRPAEVVLRDMEEALIGADVGIRTTGALLEPLRAQARVDPSPTALRAVLRETLEAILTAPAMGEPSAQPWVILVTGINGVGKTTTIGKLAALHAAAGRRVLMVAADTFRAGAIEQLSVWAERTGSDVVRHAPGGDPSAVVFDGLQAALARRVDVVLIDTAGRLHTRTPLMEELAKITRVIGREVPGAPHETLLVVDATTGQNALNQARTFAGVVPLTGVVLTKLDGTARGGVLVAIRHELGLPIRYVGVGEGVEDLRPFDAADFAAALFEADPEDAPSAAP